MSSEVQQIRQILACRENISNNFRMYFNGMYSRNLYPDLRCLPETKRGA